jgi:hypothetical protein
MQAKVALRERVANVERGTFFFNFFFNHIVFKYLSAMVEKIARGYRILAVFGVSKLEKALRMLHFLQEPTHFRVLEAHIYSPGEARPAK